MVLEDGEVADALLGAWWKVEGDGPVSGNLSRHLIASGCWTELEVVLCDVRWTLRRYEMGVERHLIWTLNDFSLPKVDRKSTEFASCTQRSKVVGPNCD